jgi:hypothetical protein
MQRLDSLETLSIHRLQERLVHLLCALTGELSNQRHGQRLVGKGMMDAPSSLIGKGDSAELQPICR